MKTLKLVVILILLSSCKKDEETQLLYIQLNNYNDHLKTTIKAQDQYLFNQATENNYFKKRYDSLNKIELKLENYFEIYRYKDRDKLTNIRDTFNIKFKLNLKLIPSANYRNVSDSIYNKLIETEFLRMRLEFQSKYMFRHRDI